MNDIDIVLNRDELVAELKRIRPLIAAEDKRKVQEHREQEREFLKQFRAACREAARWDYETAKNNSFAVRVNARVPGTFRFGRPECPTPQAEVLDRVLALLAKTGVKRFTITPNGRYSDIYRLLTFDVPTTKAVC